MCAACLWDEEAIKIERRLVNSFYAPEAAELLTLLRGIRDLQHIGDAVAQRLATIDEAAKVRMEA